MNVNVNENNEKPQKLTGGVIECNKIEEIHDYRCIPLEINYAEFMVTYRKNLFSDEKTYKNLTDVLDLSTVPEHKKKCKSLANVLIWAEPEGYGECEYLVYYTRRKM